MIVEEGEVFIVPHLLGLGFLVSSEGSPHLIEKESIKVFHYNCTYTEKKSSRSSIVTRKKFSEFVNGYFT
jgi:hypothetical protein